MDAAFILFESDPAAGPIRFAVTHRTGAWPTADAAKAAVFERVIWNAMFTDIVPHLSGTPRGERIHLDDLFSAQLVELVQLQYLSRRSHIRLVPAQPRNPPIQLRKFSLQWHHFSDCATEIRISLPKICSQFTTLLLHCEFRLNRLNLDTEEFFKTVL